MHELFTWPVWIAWSVGLVCLVRIGIAWLLRRFLAPRSAYLGAYLGIGGLFMVGVVIVGLSGMPMYGFDSSNWQHWMGYVTLFFSPLGFPLVLGTPVVALADVVRRPWRLHGADKSGAIG